MTYMERMERMERVARWLGYAFAAELLLILLLGSAAAVQLDDVGLHAIIVIGALSWLALACSTGAKPASRIASWKGTLQLAACWLIFPLFKAIRLVFIRHTTDASLLMLDRTLWGGLSLPEQLFAWERPWLSELLSLGYFLFFFIVLLPVAAFAAHRREAEARGFFLGLSLMYLLGFVGYLLLPAGGPYVAFPAVFPYPVHGGSMTAFLTKVVAGGITGMDAFPSLHSGIGVYVLGFFALGGYRSITLLLAPVVATLIVATVYLRYHYGIDVLCGVTLAGLVLAFVQRYRSSQRAQESFR